MGDFILSLTTIFGGAWELFQIKVPGFTFSFADILIAGVLASGGFLLLRMILGSSSGSGSQGRTSRSPKISEERKNDTK